MTQFKDHETETETNGNITFFKQYNACDLFVKEYLHSKTKSDLENNPVFILIKQKLGLNSFQEYHKNNNLLFRYAY